MGQAAKIGKRVVFVTYLVILHVIAAFFIYQTFFPNGLSSLHGRSTAVADPLNDTDAPTPLPIPSVFADQINANAQENTNAPLPNTNSVSRPTYEATSGLMIPVAGIKPEQLIDTFSSAR